MNDEHAKQSTDDISGQNMAREEDLHAALLHSSNPAFHTLTAMGIKGEIKPMKDKKAGKENIVETPDVKSKIKEEPTSSEEEVKIGESAVSSKKERVKKDGFKSKKKKRSKKSLIKSKNKRKSKVIGPGSKKSKEDKASSYSSKKQHVNERTLLQTGELSQFSQWLNAFATPIPPNFSPIESDAVNDQAALAQPQVTGPMAILPQKDLPETEPAIKELKRKKKRKKKRKSRAKNERNEKRSFDSGVVLSDDIFSETLADLLALQGHKKQAILMYEKMSLIYPEKSRFFAAKIEELNIK